MAGAITLLGVTTVSGQLLIPFAGERREDLVDDRDHVERRVTGPASATPSTTALPCRSGR
ncbi:hypothetical protein ILP97_41915 [Amycolatopsis sp. H6(2020)]|nr:hypothetical protein [Amycolatopsis sp. H6(2020)]